MSYNKKSNHYFKEAKLMLEVMPAVAEEACFALKGGTAINFFIRDMPRLSVDIDLTYLPIENRITSLNAISAALKSVSKKISIINSSLKIQEGKIKNTTITSKLFISNSEVQIKIEPNVVLRGSLFPTEKKSLVSKVEEMLEATVKMTIVSNADLYGGKICAALDRQHPRDFFDIKILLENEGITDEIRKGFVIYLASHDETMSQLLDPSLKDIEKEFKEEFSDMTDTPITLSELMTTRKKLITIIQKDLLENERKFLLSIKEGTPNWKLIDVLGIEKLPAIQWKLKNIQKMESNHHKKSVYRLKAILQL